MLHRYGKWRIHLCKLRMLHLLMLCERLTSDPAAWLETGSVIWHNEPVNVGNKKTFKMCSFSYLTAGGVKLRTLWYSRCCRSLMDRFSQPGWFSARHRCFREQRQIICQLNVPISSILVTTLHKKTLNRSACCWDQVKNNADTKRRILSFICFRPEETQSE